MVRNKFEPFVSRLVGTGVKFIESFYESGRTGGRTPGIETSKQHVHTIKHIEREKMV